MPLRGDRLRWPPRLSRRQTGTRQTLSTDEQSPAPRQPNEKDLSTDAQASPPRKVIEQARRDLERGLEDTDLRNRAREVIEEARGKNK
jgi:hypothetical protein